MPITPTYPGVYIEEIPSGVRTITPVATAVTAFIGRSPKGQSDEPITVQSFAAYERSFGGAARTQRTRLCGAALLSAWRR